MPARSSDDSMRPCWPCRSTARWERASAERTNAFAGFSCGAATLGGIRSAV
jgi:hypothetical protein